MNFGITASGKRVGLWGAPAEAAVPNNDLKTALAVSGGNTGNMFIGYGLYQSLDCAEKSFIPPLGSVPAETLRDYYDVVFVSASNFVNPMLDLGGTADYFERSGLPMFCFGLGSQVLPNTPLKLKPGTLAFLRLLSERSASIGVRGCFTAEVLWDLGIRNTSVTGCPSIMAIGQPSLTSLGRGRPALDKVGVNYSNNVRDHALDPAALRITENLLFQRMLSENSYYVLQNESSEMALLQRVRENPTACLEPQASLIADLFGIARSRSDLQEYLRHRIRMFSTVPAWIGSMATMSASIGSRFHGNVAALVAGTPALFLAHDMRTLEMCRLLRVPHLLIDRPYRPEALLEQLMDADYGPFLDHLPDLQTEWTLFLSRNGMEGRTP